MLLSFLMTSAHLLSSMTVAYMVWSPNYQEGMCAILPPLKMARAKQTKMATMKQKNPETQVEGNGKERTTFVPKVPLRI